MARSGEFAETPIYDQLIMEELDRVTELWRTKVFGLDQAPEPEVLPLEARPLAEGLRQIAQAPTPPGTAYRQLMDWSRQRGYAGYASVYEDTAGLPPSDKLLRSWLPRWRKGLYVSTSITSGGAALDPSLSPPEIVAENTRIAEQLTDQIIADHQFDPRDVLLSTDLPYVKGWKQSDYLIFWLMCLEGVPLDICEPFGAELGRRVAQTRLDDKTASYDEKWAGYEQLVDDFCELADLYGLYGRNDYYRQTSGIRQLVQLVDTERSLGCRAEELYARRRGISVLTFELTPDALEPALRQRIGNLAALGAQIGQPPRATRLLPAS